MARPSINRDSARGLVRERSCGYGRGMSLGHRPTPVSIAVCAAVVLLLSTAVVASVVIAVYGDPGHSPEWKQGYNDSWAQVARGAATPPAGIVRDAAVADCSSAVGALGDRRAPGPDGTTSAPIPRSIRSNRTKSEDYRAGWVKGCEDFFLTKHKNS